MAGIELLNARARARPDRRVETAEIIDLAHDGRGVARVDGKTVFIDDALPGERVEWLRIKRGRNFDEGRLGRVLEPSADRVEPRCAHFGVCGGCVLQHLAPARQLEFKQRQLYEALTRIGKVTPAETLPPLQGGVWNYRRRARLAASGRQSQANRIYSHLRDTRKDPSEHHIREMAEKALGVGRP